jgi:hypothetical protein
MSQRIDRPDCKRLAASLGLLAYAAVFCLGVLSDGLACEHRQPVGSRRQNRLRPISGATQAGLRTGHFPGGAGFTDIHGETRFVSNEVVFRAPSNVSAQAVNAMARRLGLVAISSQNLTLSGGTLFHFRIDNGRQVSDVVRELEGENIGVAQPNYLYSLQ